MFAPMLLLLAAAPAVAGLYQARQMEVGAALELQQNGHFRYQLDYGAVSEEARGHWVLEGGTLFLTTWPRPHQPSFELVRDDHAPVGEVSIKLAPPGFGEEGYRIEAIATDAATGERGLVEIDQQGRVESGKHKLSSIEPLVPVYGTIGGHFALAAGRGHHLLLRFHANDLGKAAFNREPLVLTARSLVLKRYGTEIRFTRVRP
jgi:hypothetical protein